jgi:dGTPase
MISYEVAENLLTGYRNALAHLRTREEDARRRFICESDEDRWLDQFGSPYAADADHRLGPSKALRRLMWKTQVFSNKTNPHYRNRFSHTLEVANVAVAAASILGLNHELCRAMSYGHDSGHTPFGHPGEEFLSEMMGEGKKFRHEIFGVVIAQKIERKGAGLNLTLQTLLGMLMHSRGKGQMVISSGVPEEVNLLMFADKIGYLWPDVNDIFMRGVLKLDDFPELKALVNWFGGNQRERIRTCLVGLCQESAQEGHISFGKGEIGRQFALTKDLMYGIYEGVPGDAKGKKKKLRHSQMELVYEYLCRTLPEGVNPAATFALMGDNEILNLAGRDHLRPGDLDEFSIAEILPYLKGVDPTDPDMGWEGYPVAV